MNATASAAQTGEPLSKSSIMNSRLKMKFVVLRTSATSSSLSTALKPLRQRRPDFDRLNRSNVPIQKKLRIMMAVSFAV